jgi:hypothetical protein
MRCGIDPRFHEDTVKDSPRAARTPLTPISGVPSCPQRRQRAREGLPFSSRTEEALSCQSRLQSRAAHRDSAGDAGSL